MVTSNLKAATTTARRPTVNPQLTLGAVVQRRGVGLHSGQTTTVTLGPAVAGRGRYFVRVDLPHQPEIPARLAAVGQTQLSTELQQGEATVRTVEHLLAALAGLGIDNARITVDGPELPLLDGSAQGWVEAIEAAGWVTQRADRPLIQLPHPVVVHQDDAFVAAFPASSCRLSYGIDFDVAAIGNQWFSWSPDGDPETAEGSASQGFTTEVAPARTFGLAHQIDYLRSQGLIQGGSLENALVCGHDGWVNPPLRFENEPVRHKLLDLVGDLSLLGALPQAHVVAYKASHRLHVDLAKAILAALSPGLDRGL